MYLCLSAFVCVLALCSVTEMWPQTEIKTQVEPASRRKQKSDYMNEQAGGGDRSHVAHTRNLKLTPTHAHEKVTHKGALGTTSLNNLKLTIKLSQL